MGHHPPRRVGDDCPRPQRGQQRPPPPLLPAPPEGVDATVRNTGPGEMAPCPTLLGNMLILPRLGRLFEGLDESREDLLPERPGGVFADVSSC